MSILYSIPACILLALSPTFCVIWIPIYLLSKISIKLFVFLDDKLYSIYQRSVVLFYEHITSTEVFFYGDHEKIFNKKENVLYISNHQSAVDWIISDIIIARQGGIGRLRYILKDELKYIPLYGLYFHAHGCIYVNRKKFEKEKTVKNLKYLSDNDISSWLVLFPEGTRFDKNKKRVVDSSRQFAIEKGLIPLEHHLTPRTKGIELTLENLKTKLDALYNITILYEDKKNFLAKKPWKRILPGMFEWYESPKVIHIDIQRINLSEIPKSGEAMRNWLHNLFVEKDELMKTILGKQLKSSDPEWPLKNVRKYELSLLETVPCFLFWLVATFLLLSTYWSRVIYVTATVTYAIYGICYGAFRI